MNTYFSEKCIISNIKERIKEEKTSNYEQPNHFKTPYFTIIKPEEHFSHNKSSNHNYNSFMPKINNDKYNSSQYSKRQNGHKHYPIDEHKENEGSNKYNRRVVGYSKFNYKNERAHNNAKEKLNSSFILKCNLEKKDSAQSQGTADNICDNKSINSLETQNTINEEDFDKVEDYFTTNRFKTEDFKPVYEKNVKLNYMKSHCIDINKYKSNAQPGLGYEDYKVRKTLSEVDSFPSNKFSQSYNSQYSEYINKNNIYPGFFFNPLGFDGNTFPFYPHRKENFSRSLYNRNENLYSDNFIMNNSIDYQSSLKQNKHNTNIMEELTNLKEECLAVNQNNELSKYSNLVKKPMNIEDNKSFKESPEKHIINKINKAKIQEDLTKDPSMNVSIRISSTVTKIIKIYNHDEAFIITKKFCSENALNDKLFYSIYKKIKAALNKFYTLSKKKDCMEDLFSSTYNILSKVKRSHSHDFSELGKNLI